MARAAAARTSKSKRTGRGRGRGRGRGSSRGISHEQRSLDSLLGAATAATASSAQASGVRRARFSVGKAVCFTDRAYQIGSSVAHAGDVGVIEEVIANAEGGVFYIVKVQRSVVSRTSAHSAFDMLALKGQRADAQFVRAIESKLFAVHNPAATCLTLTLVPRDVIGEALKRGIKRARLSCSEAELKQRRAKVMSI